MPTLAKGPLLNIKNCALRALTLNRGGIRTIQTDTQLLYRNSVTVNEITEALAIETRWKTTFVLEQEERDLASALGAAPVPRV